jgi:hypothetical protein
MFPALTSISAFLLVGALLAAPASAQDTREGEIARRQAEKSKQLRPNTATGTEKVLDWLEDYFTDPNTVYLTFGGVYPSAGLAPGVALRQAFGHARFNVGGAYSIRNYKLAHVSLDFPELLNDHVEIETGVRWRDATQVPFYGIGNDTAKESRVNYGLRVFEAEGAVTLKPVKWYRIGAGIGALRYEDRAGVGSHPSIETVGAPLPGLLSEANYTKASVFTAIDWRESSGYTRRGGLYSVTFNNFTESDDRLGFRRIDGEIQQYLPILKEHWILVFRGLVQTTDVDNGQQVPYYLLPTLGGARRHRGYSDFRFQDRHMLLLTGEYRWTPSRVLDMAIFVDAGKVTSDRADLDLDGLKTGYGIGFRIHGPTFTPLRLDIARTKEGPRIHLTGGVAF